MPLRQRRTIPALHDRGSGYGDDIQRYIGQKVFLGGFIVPGVQTSLRAISAGTAQLPPIAPEPPEHLIGANTVAALNNGAMFGTAAMLTG